MKKVSAKVFFTVLWRGVCQVLGWFFGLFGYKRDGKFAKCVWGLFATSSAIVMAVIAIALISAIGFDLYDEYYTRNDSCDYPYCGYTSYISRDIYFHNHGDGKGYVFNVHTGEKYIENVAWISKPTTDQDSLIFFSDGKKRGYFSKNTGKVVIEPKYDHAWIFSEGLASIEEDGKIKFINEAGEVVIDKNMPYIPGMQGYVFHGGYCVVDTDDGKLCGLMDRKGDIVLPMEYDFIDPSNDYEYWCLRKGDYMAVIDKELQYVLPLTGCSLGIMNGIITMIKPDHTMCRYDTQGTLINDFYIYDVRLLEYETDEILYRSVMLDYGGEDDVPFVESYHPLATARLRAYVAGDYYEGLMTPDGHIVTMPLYKDIEAIGSDLYLCTYNYQNKVVVNGKGEIVEQEM